MKKTKNHWLIEANLKNKDKHTQRFIEEGIWINSFDDSTEDIVNSIEKDDTIAIKLNLTRQESDKTYISVLRIIAIGKVERNYQNGKNLEVNWENIKPYNLDYLSKSELITKLSLNSDIKHIFKPTKKQQIDLTDKKNNLKPSMDLKDKSRFPLNQTFYGSSGTGKTYQAILRSLEIIDGFVPKSKKEVLNRFEYLKENGRLAFTSMHESYSYEQFIESKEYIDNKVKLKQGIFKEISSLAAAEITKVNKRISFNIDNKTNRFFKLTLGKNSPQKGDNTFYYCLENNFIALDMMGGIDYSIIENTKKWSIAQGEIGELYFSEEDPEKRRLAIRSIYYFKNFMRRGNIVFISNDNEYIEAIGVVKGLYEFRDIHAISFTHFRKVEWLLKDCKIPIGKFYQGQFSEQPVDYLNKSKLLWDNLQGFIDSNYKGERNYVILIDEINRCNISKVFGEVTTLIEEDKRIGEEEELELILPYSGDSFGVPNNLYVISTINPFYETNQFDQLLRRKFNLQVTEVNYSFLDINIDGIQVNSVLEKINKRIEYLLDENMIIGHGYFSKLIKSPSFDNLRLVFKDKIIPLLKTIFQDDYEKISLVLGDNQKNDSDDRFVHSEKLFDNDLFGERVSKSTSKDSYKIIIPVNPNSFIKIY